MKLLQASVLVFALLMAACESGVSPTEPAAPEIDRTQVVPPEPGFNAEQPERKAPRPDDEKE